MQPVRNTMTYIGDKYRISFCDRYHKGYGNDYANNDVQGQWPPNISVPTRIAVIGSNTPSTEALVAPIFRVAIANVAVETMVGNIANFWGSVHFRVTPISQRFKPEL